MTTYNTSGDAANTAVRSLLTKIGEYYLQKSFNTSSGNGKKEWERIKQEVFNNQCAYCNADNQKLQIEHLIMFNRTEYGLHHPGNVVPSCSECNKRYKIDSNKYSSWEEHLAYICKSKNEEDQFEIRLNKIKKHIKDENYPNLTSEEESAIKVIAQSLYDNIKNEMDKSLNLYKNLDAEFVNKKNDE